jgi:hypothetical protein
LETTYFFRKLFNRILSRHGQFFRKLFNFIHCGLCQLFLKALSTTWSHGKLTNGCFLGSFLYLFSIRFNDVYEKHNAVAVVSIIVSTTRLENEPLWLLFQV